MHLTQGSYASRAWLPVKSSPVNLYRGAGMGVGVGGGGSQILDQVDDDDDDDDDGLPRTKKERSAEAPRPLNRAALADQFDVRREAVLASAV